MTVQSWHDLAILGNVGKKTFPHFRIADGRSLGLKVGVRTFEPIIGTLAGSLE